MSDPHFANVRLLLLGDGANGSQSIIDSSSYAHTVTVQGNAQISTSSPKFGSGSLLFDSSSPYDYLQIASSDLILTAPCTIDWWMNTTTSLRGEIFSHNVVTRNSSSFHVNYNISLDQLQMLIGSGSNNLLTASSAGCRDGNWHHVAVVGEDGGGGSDTYRFFVDGVHKVSNTVGAAGSNWNSNFGDSSGWAIGALVINNLQSATRYDGNIDCFRATAVARWTGTSSFTPPTSLNDYLETDPPTGGPFPHYINDSLLGGLNAMRERVRRFISLPSGILAPRPGIILPRGC